MKIVKEVTEALSVLLILIAYTLISFNFITSSNFQYHLLNLFGAAGIIYISLKKKLYQPTALNIIWALIAITGLARIAL